MDFLKKRGLLDVPPEEAGDPATQEELTALTPDQRSQIGLASLVEHIQRLRDTRDPLLVEEADTLESRVQAGENLDQIIRPYNIQRIKEVFRNLSMPEIYVYGGTSFSLRRQEGSWPTANCLGDFAGVDYSEGKRISFGVVDRPGSNKVGAKALILRAELNVQQGRRRECPYTIFIDFGEKVWQSVKYNYALVIEQILNNSNLLDKILNRPEDLNREDFALLANQGWGLSNDRNATLDDEVQAQIGSGTNRVFSVPPSNLATPQEMTLALDRIPKAQRKQLTWIVGGSAGLGDIYKINLVYAPNN